MSLRRLLGATALGVGGLLVANRRLRDDDLPPALEGRQQTVGWRGLDVPSPRPAIRTTGRSSCCTA